MSKKEAVNTVTVTLELRTAATVKKLSSKKLWKDAIDGMLDAKVVSVGVEEPEVVETSDDDEGDAC